MVAVDRFPVSGTLDSADHGFVVTPSDAVDFPAMSRALYVGTAGDVAVVFRSGAVVVFTCPAGAQLNVRARRVNATGTAPGTGIVALV